ncbi:STAS domain-containing protein [Henriciella mobilis]|uniref:STAS domain-containing protein n=1 Tax=Henriciella mobilis TaxID=2305467 RepID=UPI000E6744FA|nr:STAS domain-containing protein [Henriciella mobilis]RIJ13793.1 STAS domain-containing protein [Henriciella mobilis]RIJ20998.1 STAS domain-containing protein [Henriciella mobilis]
MSALDGANSITLPDDLSGVFCEALKADLLARRGQPLELDASNVVRCGGQAVQLLVSAKRSWASDGQPFAIVNPEADFIRIVQLTGLQDELFPESGADT